MRASASTDPHRGDRAGATPRSVSICAAAVLLIALFAVLAPRGAHSRSLAAEETAALAATVARFDTAMRESRFADVVDVIPPRVLQAIASKGGGTVDDLRKAMLEQIDRAMRSVKIVSFAMDLQGGRHAELADGSPYVLIPTRTWMDAGSKGRLKASSETLALLDEGKWYLLRVENQGHVALLRETYPGFGNVEFAKGTMEIEKK